MTAYRQQALVCAAMLQAGPARPRNLRTVAPEAGRILLRNVYCWFEPTERGVYRLNSQGEAALHRWPQTAQLAARMEPSNRSAEQTDQPATVYLNWTVQLLVRALIAPTSAEEEMAVPSSRAAAPVQPLSAGSGGACVKTPYRNDKEHCRFAEG